MRPRKYHVTLTEEEYKYLNELTRKGTASAQKIQHAQIILKLDETFNEKPWPVERISQAYGACVTTVITIAQRFVEGGLDAALNRKKQLNRHHKITGEVEAHIVAIACSQAPEGREKWTLQMIADRLVELKVIDSISATAVGTTLKKTSLSHGSRKNGVSRKREQNS